MKPQKPRVIINADATYVNVEWNSIPMASYYTVKYSLADNITIINTLNVTSCSVILTSLIPNTEYTVYVSTTVITQSSQFTTLNFRTLPTNILQNKGSGNTLYPSDFTNSYNLDMKSDGYYFSPGKNSLYADGNFFQFCSFDLGNIKNKSYFKLQLQGTSGDWITSSDKNGYFDNTILQVKIDPHTGWMNANSLRVPGIEDKENGARVFDGAVEGEWNTIRITLSNMNFTSYEGTLYVRIGLPEGKRTISGVKIFS